MLQQQVHCLLDINHLISSIISKKLIRAYNGYDSDAVKYVKKVKALIDKPLDELKLEDVRAIRKKVKFPANWIFHCFTNWPEGYLTKS